MFGKVAGDAIIYALPWLLAAYPIILICVVIMYKNGDFVDATLNTILSGVLMGQNFVRGIIALTLLAAGKEVSTELMLSSYAIDQWVYLVGGIILLFAGWLAHFQSKMAAIGVWAGAIGVFSTGCNECRNGRYLRLVWRYRISSARCLLIKEVVS